MKKAFYLLFLLLLIFTVSCGKQKKELYFSEDEVSIEIGSTYELNYTKVGFEEDVEIFVSNESVVSLSGNTLTAKALGNAEILIVYDDLEASLNVTVTNPTAKEIKSRTDEYNFDLETTGLIGAYVIPSEASQDVTYEVTDSSVCTVNENGMVTAKSLGTTTLKITSKENANVSKEVTVNVVRPLATSFDASTKKDYFKVNSTTSIDFTIEPAIALQEVKYTSTDPTVLSVDENGVVTGLKIGTASIIVSTIDGTEFSVEIPFRVKTDAVDTTAPEFVFDEGYSKVYNVNYFTGVSVLDGIKAIDNIDGDLTADIVIESDDSKVNYNYTHHVVLSCTDESGNKATITREYTVRWDYTCQFIGHMGSYYGVANTESAFLAGASVMKYQVLETDLRQTKDGVFVCNHDADYQGYTISKYTYDELKDIKKLQKNTGSIPYQKGLCDATYTDTLCTLETYLKICKTYGCTALIELKDSKGISDGSNSRMPALMQLIEECGMLDNTKFLTYSESTIKWVKDNGYTTVGCQYITDVLDSQTKLDFCKKYGCEISVNVTYSTYAGYTEEQKAAYPEWIKKYHDAGIKISTYTFDQYGSLSQIQEWIDKGVDYVTTDWHLIDDCTLYTK